MALLYHSRRTPYGPIINTQTFTTILTPPAVNKIYDFTVHEAVHRAARLRATIKYSPFIHSTFSPPEPIDIPRLVQTDPKAQPRTREHLDMVSAIFNSLILQREIVIRSGATARGDWKLGYVPTTSGDWTSPAPTTVKDALDRLASGGLNVVDGGTF